MLRWHQGKKWLFFLKNEKCHFSTLKSIYFNNSFKKSLKKLQFGFNLPFYWTLICFLHFSNDLSNALSPMTLKRKIQIFAPKVPRCLFITGKFGLICRMYFENTKMVFNNELLNPSKSELLNPSKSWIFSKSCLQGKFNYK